MIFEYTFMSNSPVQYLRGKEHNIAHHSRMIYLPIKMFSVEIVVLLSPYFFAPAHIPQGADAHFETICV